MTASVRIENEAWGDLRFATLARLCGLADAEHALIRCARIWSWQTEHYTDTDPTYVVDEDIIISALGPAGPAAMVRARLAEQEPIGFRIRGSEGRIEWLWAKRKASAKGGEAMKRKHRHKKEPIGLPAGSPSAGPNTEPNPSPLTLALTLPEERETTRARERPPDVGAVAHEVWLHANAKANELRAANVNVKPWPLMASGQHSGWIALLDRVGELLVGSGADEARRRAINRVDVAAATARSSGEGHWFTPNRMFSKNSFDTFVDDDPSAIERKPTAATKRGPTDPIRKTNVL